MQHYIGFDPDLHQPSLALVGEDGAVRAVWCLRHKKRLKGRAAVVACSAFVAEFFSETLMPLYDGTLEIAAFAVESQEVYRGAGQDADTKDPRALMFLAAVSGVVLGLGHVIWPKAAILFPAPAEWKGNVPKEVHHARLMEEQKWQYKVMGAASKAKKNSRYCSPDPESVKHLIGVEDLNAGDWKHVCDAIGLAMFARKAHSTGLIRKAAANAFRQDQAQKGRAEAKSRKEQG